MILGSIYRRFSRQSKLRRSWYHNVTPSSFPHLLDTKPILRPPLMYFGWFDIGRRDGQFYFAVHENSAHHKLFFRLRSEDSASLSRAGLERDRQYAHAV
jgi:hypothetical protein